MQIYYRQTFEFNILNISFKINTIMIRYIKLIWDTKNINYFC